MSDYKILLVDDDRDIGLTLKLGLEDSDIEIVYYDSPIEALKEFVPYYYNLLLIDVRMPEMTGFELYEQIKLRDPQVRVCFITSFSVYHKYLAANLGVNCFIKKPILISALKQRIKSELSK